MSVDTLRLTAEAALGLIERREASAAELHRAYLDAVADRDGEPVSALPDPGPEGWLLVVGPEGGLEASEVDRLGAVVARELRRLGAEPVTLGVIVRRVSNGIRTGHGSYRLGCEFVGLDEENRRKIERFLKVD